MATAARHKNYSLAMLENEAPSYEFFQLVRLVQRFIQQDHKTELQFKVSPALAFPVAEIAKLQIQANNKKRQLECYVNFIGLIGHSGTLPNHYTEYLLERLQAKDTNLIAFLDLFHDHLLKLFYQVSQLSHFYISYEQQQDHLIPSLLRALSGQSNFYQRDAQLYFAGLFGMKTRSSEGLLLILQAYFKLPIKLQQFIYEKLYLTNDDLMQLGQQNTNNHLGKNSTLGKSVWEVQNRFAVVIGPVDYAVFNRLLPGGDMLRSMHQMIKAYCGIELDYEIRVLLRADVLPVCALSKNKNIKLGWNAKLPTRTTANHCIQVKISTNKLKQVI